MARPLGDYLFSELPADFRVGSKCEILIASRCFPFCLQIQT
jgi:hypothetical protein